MENIRKNQKSSKWIKIYGKSVKTKLKCKLNEDTMAKKQTVAKKKKWPTVT